jgi:hypothetical protein
MSSRVKWIINWVHSDCILHENSKYFLQNLELCICESSRIIYIYIYVNSFNYEPIRHCDDKYVIKYNQNVVKLF